MPVRGLKVSDLRKVNEYFADVTDPFTGETLAAVRAIRPDFAVVHAQIADSQGNAFFEGPKYEDVLLSRASQKVIVTAERIVGDGYFFRRRAQGGHSAFSDRRRGACRPRRGPRRVLRLLRAGWRADSRLSGAQGRAGAGALPYGRGEAAVIRPCDMMTVAMARLIHDGDTVFHGVSSHMPMIATLLARRLHAPNAVHLNIPGGVDPVKPALREFTSAGGELWENGLRGLSADGGVRPEHARRAGRGVFERRAVRRPGQRQRLRHRPLRQAQGPPARRRGQRRAHPHGQTRRHLAHQARPPHLRLRRGLRDRAGAT